jgi:microcystin-dependent protein
LGERGGEQAHTLSISELPQHVHVMNASSSPGDGAVPTSTLLGSPLNLSYRPADGLVAINPGSITNTGGSQAHLNMQPFLTLSFCIALQGIFPSPT